MFGSSYIYCKVSFDTPVTYYYRTDIQDIKAGDRVIVPISNNGKWKIGLVVTVEKYSSRTVPYPLDQTKGIVSKAGFGSESKVNRHNTKIDRSKYPPLDISQRSLKTKKGYVFVITTSAERESIRRKQKYGKLVLIENYPPATREEVLFRPKEIDDLKWIDELEMLEDVFDDQW